MIPGSSGPEASYRQGASSGGVEGLIEQFCSGDFTSARDISDEFKASEAAKLLKSNPGVLTNVMYSALDVLEKGDEPSKKRALALLTKLVQQYGERSINAVISHRIHILVRDVGEYGLSSQKILLLNELLKVCSHEGYTRMISELLTIEREKIAYRDTSVGKKHIPSGQDELKSKPHKWTRIFAAPAKLARKVASFFKR